MFWSELEVAGKSYLDFFLFSPSFAFPQDFYARIRGSFPFYCLIVLQLLKFFLLAFVTYVCSLTFLVSLNSVARRKGHK